MYTKHWQKPTLGPIRTQSNMSSHQPVVRLPVSRLGSLKPLRRPCLTVFSALDEILFRFLLKLLPNFACLLRTCNTFTFTAIFLAGKTGLQRSPVWYACWQPYFNNLWSATAAAGWSGLTECKAMGSEAAAVQKQFPRGPSADRQDDMRHHFLLLWDTTSC